MIKILHLYYDIMNMYGESANIRALDTPIISAITKQYYEQRQDKKPE